MLEIVEINKDNKYWDRISKNIKLDINESLKLNFLSGINVVIGENGVGKTSLIKSIRERLMESPEMKGISFKLKKNNEKQNVYFFLSEDNNARLNLSEVSPFEENYAYKIAHWYNRKELSSGQNTFEFLEDAISLSEKARIIFFDEPEQALDAIHLLKFKNLIEKISKDVQIIIISHHPALILDKNYNIVEFNSKKPYLNEVKNLLSNCNL